MKFRSILALLSASVVVAGCVPAITKPLAEESRAQLAPTSVVVNLPQREINLEIVRSQTTAAMGGGLLWALVDSAVDNSRATDAEQTVQPARDALIGFDVDGLVRERAQTRLAELDWLGTSDVAVTRNDAVDWREQAINGSASTSHLFADASYTFSADASRVTFHVNSQLYALSPEHKARIADRLDGQGRKPSSPLVADEVRFATTIHFESALPSAGKDHAANIAIWAADGGRLLRSALTAAVDQTTSLLATELAAPAVAQTGANGKPVKIKIRNVSYDLIKREEGLTLARGVDDSLWAFHVASP